MVGAAVVLKALNQLPNALPREELVRRLERVFGKKYHREEGGSCSAAELVDSLLAAGDLLQGEEGLSVSPDWACRREKKAE